MNERTQFFRKEYLSHFILERVAKKLCVRGELETEQTATYWPEVPQTIAAHISHSGGLLNRGSLPRTATWTPTNWLQLTLTICGTRLYNCLTSTCFLWAYAIAPNSTRPQVKVIFRYLRLDVLVSWLTAGSRASMLHLYTISGTYSYFKLTVVYHWWDQLIFQIDYCIPPVVRCHISNLPLFTTGDILSHFKLTGITRWYIIIFLTIRLLPTVVHCRISNWPLFTTICHHQHHVPPPAQISLTLSRHSSLSSIAPSRSSSLYPVSVQSCCI